MSLQIKVVEYRLIFLGLIKGYKVFFITENRFMENYLI